MPGRSSIHITISDVKAKNLPKIDLFNKGDPYVLFQWPKIPEFRTPTLVKETHCDWEDWSYSFDYQIPKSAKLTERNYLKTEKLIIEIYSKSQPNSNKKDHLFGYISINLYNLFSGPQHHIYSLFNERGSIFGAMVEFHIKIEYERDVLINLTDTFFKSLNSANNDINNNNCNQPSDDLKSYFFTAKLPSISQKEKISSVCYDSKKPHWPSFPPISFFTDVQRLFAEEVEIGVYSIFNKQVQFEGKGMIYLSKYNTPNENEHLYFQISIFDASYNPNQFTDIYSSGGSNNNINNNNEQYIIGVMGGFISYDFLPIPAQMLHGYLSENIIFESIPIISHLPFPSDFTFSKKGTEKNSLIPAYVNEYKRDQDDDEGSEYGGNILPDGNDENAEKFLNFLKQLLHSFHSQNQQQNQPNVDDFGLSIFNSTNSMISNPLNSQLKVILDKRGIIEQLMEIIINSIGLLSVPLSKRLPRGDSSNYSPPFPPKFIEIISSLFPHFITCLYHLLSCNYWRQEKFRKNGGFSLLSQLLFFLFYTIPTPSQHHPYFLFPIFADLFLIFSKRDSDLQIELKDSENNFVASVLAIILDYDNIECSLPEITNNGQLIDINIQRQRIFTMMFRVLNSLTFNPLLQLIPSDNNDQQQKKISIIIRDLHTGNEMIDESIYSALPHIIRFLQYPSDDIRIECCTFLRQLSERNTSLQQYIFDRLFSVDNQDNDDDIDNSSDHSVFSQSLRSPFIVNDDVLSLLNYWVDYQRSIFRFNVQHGVNNLSESFLLLSAENTRILFEFYYSNIHNSFVQSSFKKILMFFISAYKNSQQNVLLILSHFHLGRSLFSSANIIDKNNDSNNNNNYDDTKHDINSVSFSVLYSQISLFQKLLKECIRFRSAMTEKPFLKFVSRNVESIINFILKFSLSSSSDHHHGDAEIDSSREKFIDYCYQSIMSLFDQPFSPSDNNVKSSSSSSHTLPSSTSSTPPLERILAKLLIDTICTFTVDNSRSLLSLSYILTIFAQFLTQCFPSLSNLGGEIFSFQLNLYDRLLQYSILMDYSQFVSSINNNSNTSPFDPQTSQQLISSIVTKSGECLISLLQLKFQFIEIDGLIKVIQNSFRAAELSSSSSFPVTSVYHPIQRSLSLLNLLCQKFGTHPSLFAFFTNFSLHFLPTYFQKLDLHRHHSDIHLEDENVVRDYNELSVFIPMISTAVIAGNNSDFLRIIISQISSSSASQAIFLVYLLSKFTDDIIDHQLHPSHPRSITTLNIGEENLQKILSILWRNINLETKHHPFLQSLRHIKLQNSMQLLTFLLLQFEDVKDIVLTQLIDVIFEDQLPSYISSLSDILFLLNTIVDNNSNTTNIHINNSDVNENALFQSSQYNRSTKKSYRIIVDVIGKIVCGVTSTSFQSKSLSQNVEINSLLLLLCNLFTDVFQASVSITHSSSLSGSLSLDDATTVWKQLFHLLEKLFSSSKFDHLNLFLHNLNNRIGCILHSLPRSYNMNGDLQFHALLFSSSPFDNLSPFISILFNLNLNDSIQREISNELISLLESLSFHSTSHLTPPPSASSTTVDDRNYSLLLFHFSPYFPLLFRSFSDHLKELMHYEAEEMIWDAQFSRLEILFKLFASWKNFDRLIDDVIHLFKSILPFFNSVISQLLLDLSVGNSVDNNNGGNINSNDGGDVHHPKINISQKRKFLMMINTILLSIINLIHQHPKKINIFEIWGDKGFLILIHFLILLFQLLNKHLEIIKNDVDQMSPPPSDNNSEISNSLNHLLQRQEDTNDTIMMNILLMPILSLLKSIFENPIYHKEFVNQEGLFEVASLWELLITTYCILLKKFPLPDDSSSPLIINDPPSSITPHQHSDSSNIIILENVNNNNNNNNDDNSNNQNNEQQSEDEKFRIKIQEMIAEGNKSISIHHFVTSPPPVLSPDYKNKKIEIDSLSTCLIHPTSLRRRILELSQFLITLASISYLRPHMVGEGMIPPTLNLLNAVNDEKIVISVCEILNLLSSDTTAKAEIVDSSKTDHLLVLIDHFNPIISYAAKNSYFRLGGVKSRCTFNQMVQEYFRCRTCGLNDGICMSCARSCHRGHYLSPMMYGNIQCACGQNPHCLVIHFPTLRVQLPLKVCTYQYTGKSYAEQIWYYCKTCFKDQMKGVCAICTIHCHHGHDLRFGGEHRFYCDCNSRYGNLCKCLTQPETAADSSPHMRKPKFLKEKSSVLHSEDDDSQIKDNDEDDNDVCVVCMENPKEALFYKCGHLVTCMDCGYLIKQRNDNCVICRSPVIDVIQTYRV